MKAERWRFGREAADEAEVAKIVAKKKKQAIALIEGAGPNDARPFVRAREIAFELARVHGRPDAAREVMQVALPLLPRGMGGARVRESYWALELDVCVAMGLETDAAKAADEAGAASAKGTYAGQLGDWLFGREAYAAAADAFQKAAGRQDGVDPWSLKAACAWSRAGDAAAAAEASKRALDAIDRKLPTLSAPHMGTARAAATIRKGVALALLGDADAAKQTFADARTQAEPSAALALIADDPVWSDIVRPLASG